MRWIKRVLGGFVILLGVAIAAVGIAIGYDAACPERPEIDAAIAPSQAIVYRCYGGPEVLALEPVVTPVPAADQVLVRVHAAAVNPLDWHYLRGKPYLLRLLSGIGHPSDTRLGVDFAGVVEAVGASVTGFKPGDAVFGGASGAFGEYVVVRGHRAIALKPANVSFAAAAATPIAAVTALQALRDKARLRAGQKVLVNGASGGVGTYAVQIAKAWGAEVIAVCSTRNVELVRSLGADHVIDYTQENFTTGDVRYDVIIDNVGSHSLADYLRVLATDGVLVTVGDAGMGDWVDPLLGPLQSALAAPFISQRLEGILAELNQADLVVLAAMLQSGELRSVLDRRYPLAEVPAAVAYVEKGRARGKVIIDVVPAADVR